MTAVDSPSYMSFLTRAKLEIEPRPYQIDAFRAILAEFHGGRHSTLLVMPTGAGKTLMFGLVARYVIDDLGGRVLVLAHRGELLDQAAAKLDLLGIESVIEKAEADGRQALEDAASSVLSRQIKCVIGSVQTLREKRLRRWPRDFFKLVITDEAHHAPATSYDRIYEHFAPAWHLGVTATADRLDELDLGAVYESKAFEYSMADAISDGWLCRLRAEKADVRVDLRGIRTTAGDFNAGDLEDRISAHIEPLANATREKIGDRKTLVFTPDVGSAQAFAQGLQQVGIKARAVWGECSERRSLIAGFAKGEFQAMTNCALLCEGYDCPEISAIVLARPTQSRALLAQMVGRGTRIAPGKSDGCLIVDFDWQLDRHSLCKPVSLIAPTADPGLLAIAAELVESGELPDLMEALDAAEGVKLDRDWTERIENAIRQAERVRVQVRQRPTLYSWTVFDPVGGVRDFLGVQVQESFACRRIKATDKQIAFLLRAGVTEPEAKSMSRRTAHCYIEEIIDRRNRKLATVRQVRCLVRKGVDREEAVRLDFEEASRMLDNLLRRQTA